jgi:hypothetical protein
VYTFFFFLFLLFLFLFLLFFLCVCVYVWVWWGRKAVWIEKTLGVCLYLWYMKEMALEDFNWPENIN